MKRNVIILFVALLGLSWFTALSEAVNDPKELKAHLDRAAELEEKGIYVDAAAEYESALEYDPDNVDIHIKMAQAYLYSGESREFILICESTAENYQDNTEALDLLMDYYVENHYEDKAVKYLQEFIKTYPDNENASNWFVKLEGSYTELFCRYTQLSGIVNDTMVVCDGELYGIADAEGRELVPAMYKTLQPFSEDGFALAEKTDGTWIYIDKDGQTRKVPDEEYQDFGMLNEDRAPASKGGMFGYLDEEMEPTGEFAWDKLTAVKEGTGAGQTGEKWAIVDENGEAKSEDRYEDVIVDEDGFCSNQKRIFAKEGDAYHLIDEKEKTVGDLSFENARAFTNEGYAAVCNDGKWGFINTDGELVIDYIYDDAKSFKNGFAAVAVEGYWGYIDEEGNLVIEPQFSEATYFSGEGTVAVKVLSQGEEDWQLLQLSLFQ